MITISTAGARLDSPLGELRELAHGLPTFRRDGVHNTADASGFVFHEWCLGAGDDVDDLDLVAEANPASWQTVEKLRQRHDSPSMTKGQWLRFACGVWTEGEEPWIDPVAWDKLADPGLELDPDEYCWLGVDIGVKKDSTGLVLVQAQDDGRLAVKARILRPPVKGALPLARVEQEIRDICLEWTVRGVVYDPWSFRRSAELLEADGIPTVEFAQSNEKMTLASVNLHRMINAGELVHDGNREFRAQVMGGITKETERGWRIHKDPKRRPIDALVALAMAALIANDMKPSVYETREPVAV